jgi:hypothetical protein
MTMAATTRPRITHETPGLFILLIDQSGSMGKPFQGSEFSKAEAVAATVNKTIENLILTCMAGDVAEHYYDVAAIGYGDGDVRIAFGGTLADLSPIRIEELAANPLRVAVEDVEVNGKVRKRRSRIWIEPRHGGKTPMSAALEAAGAQAADWAHDYENSIPPIVLNIRARSRSDLRRSMLYASGRSSRSRGSSAARATCSRTVGCITTTRSQAPDNATAVVRLTVEKP